MREVTGAVIATSLVLVAVFVPVALFPGTTGILFRQFALTIAFSVAISAFNALTLTPSLSAILLGHHRERSQGRFFKAFNRVVASGTEGYRRALAVAIRWKFAALLAFALLLGATYVLYNRVPQGFIPEDDQGYLIVAVNAPQGASLQYTLGVCSQVEKVASQSKDIEGTFAIGGFGFSGSASNRAIVFLPLKSFEERKGEAHSADAVLTQLRGPLMGIQGALVRDVQDLGDGVVEQLEVVTHDEERTAKWKTWDAIRCRPFRTPPTNLSSREI